MKSHTLPIFAAALAGGAIGTLATLSLSAPDSSLVADPDTTIRGRLVDQAGPAMDARFQELEARLTRLSLVKPKETPRPQTREPSSASVDANQELKDRLAALEKEISTVRAREAGMAFDKEARDQAVRRMLSGRERASHDDARTTILDSTKTGPEKVAAWAALRDAETWGDSVVLEMIAIGENSEDADLRADVWRQADGRARNPLLAGPLLRALQSDPDDGVRSEAAETLENYIDEAGVRDALIYASQHDSSRSVRKEARGALN